MSVREPARVLFLCWGPSVHAVRRIGLFVDDPSFAVGVASTHDHAFEGAEQFLLSDEAARKAAMDRLHAREDYRGNRERMGFLPANGVRIGNRIRKAYAVWRALSGVGACNLATFRRVHGTWETVYQIDVGAMDLALLSRAVARFRPDVLFLQTMLYPCYLATYLPRRIPSIVTFWNGDVVWWSQWDGADRHLKRAIVAAGARRAAAVTVNSRIAAERCLEYGVPQERIHLIRYPGVDRERFSPGSKEEARRALRIASGKVVFCPRGVEPYLNADVIVEAVGKVAAAVPDVLFVFASGGKGETLLPNLLARVRELGLADRVRWEGKIPFDTMPRYYRAADAMVSVSSRDSLPNCLLEAMACGTPVILGDIPPIRDFVDEGVRGWLVPPRDAERLAAALLEILHADGEALSRIVRQNMDMVAREADAEKGAAAIKALVRRVAGKEG